MGLLLRRTLQRGRQQRQALQRLPLPPQPPPLRPPASPARPPARPPSPTPYPAVAQQQVVGLEAKVAAITEMGFGREQALAALKRANGDEQQAMEFLLGGA